MNQSKLIEAIKKITTEKGNSNIIVSDIAKTLNISRQAVHYNFGTLDNMFNIYANFLILENGREKIRKMIKDRIFSEQINNHLLRKL